MFQIRKETSVTFKLVISAFWIFYQRFHHAVMRFHDPIVLEFAIWTFNELFVVESKGFFQDFASCITNSSSG